MVVMVPSIWIFLLNIKMIAYIAPHEGQEGAIKTPTDRSIGIVMTYH